MRTWQRGVPVETIERGILGIPLVGRVYRNHAATLKRGVCLGLHRVGVLRPISFVQWLATNQCCLSCPFCESSSGEPGANELGYEEALDLIRDLAGMGVRYFVLSGGEPLMRPDICALMAEANRHGLVLGLVTNGWHVAQLEQRLRSLRFFLYFTSIDGPPDFHDRVRGRQGAFSRAMQGLDVFARMDVPARLVNTVVHPGNIDQLPALRDIIAGSAATSWRLTPVSAVGRAAGNPAFELSSSQLRELANFVRESRRRLNADFGESHTYLGCLDGHVAGKPFFCGAGLSRCSIMPDGDVLGCHQIYDRRYSEGNIRDKPFSRIWREGFARFRRNEFPADCRTCPHLAACRGGCWAEMEKRGGCLKSAWDQGDG